MSRNDIWKHGALSSKTIMWWFQDVDVVIGLCVCLEKTKENRSNQALQA